MALKPLRKVLDGSDIAYVLNEVAEKGVVVIMAGTSGTGKPGDANNTAMLPLSGAGTAIGILMTDTVSLELSRQPHLARNHRDEVPVFSPVTVLSHGFCYTNMVSGNPTPGQSAYFTVGGIVTATNTGSAVIGRFRGVKDADGYIGVDVTVGV